MTRSDVMDMSSFSLSFKSCGNDSTAEDISAIMDKMSTTGRQLLIELESAKKASCQSSQLVESLAGSKSSTNLFETEKLKNSTPNQMELQARCEKLEDVVLFLLQENATLNRFRRETDKLCIKCKNPLEDDRQKRMKTTQSQVHVCTGCSKHLKLVMEKAAELQLENDKHILRICKMEEIISTLEEKEECESTYKLRIEELHNQLLLKETEIEHLKDTLNQNALRKDMMTSAVHSRDICNQKEVLQLCEKYERLKNAYKKVESDLVKLGHNNMESTTRILDLERQLHQSMIREESNKLQLEEAKKLEKLHAIELELTRPSPAHHLDTTSSTHDEECCSHSVPDRIVRPKSILKKTSHRGNVSSSATSTSFAIGNQHRNPIIINEKRSSTALERSYQSPHKYARGILDVGKKVDTTSSGSNLDTSSSSDSFIKRSFSDLDIEISSGNSTKFFSGKDQCDVDVASPSSGTSEHIGRYEFLQEMRHQHSTGKTSPDAAVGLSARQQEYANKLIKKYTKGLTLSGDSY